MRVCVKRCVLHVYRKILVTDGVRLIREFESTRGKLTTLGNGNVGASRSSPQLSWIISEKSLLLSVYSISPFSFLSPLRAQVNGALGGGHCKFLRKIPLASNNGRYITPLHHARHEHARHLLLVPRPVISIFLGAGVVVAQRAVY